jgi:hypothetical protein
MVLASRVRNDGVLDTLTSSEVTPVLETVSA